MATGSINNLTISVNSTSAAAAAANLNSMAQAGNSAAASMGGLGNSAKSAATAAAATATATAGVASAANQAGHATAGVTRELIVLAHELSQGNFKKFGGSLLVLAEYGQTAVNALSKLAIPAAFIGAIGAFAVAAYKGAQESEALRISLIATGNYAGLTEGKFNELSAAIAKATNTTIGSARGGLQELVNTGRFTGDTLTAAGKAAEYFGKATGESSENVAKLFERLADHVSRGADELNKTYHFLTAAQVEQIRTLEEQGRANDALTITFNALSERLKGTTENIGTLGKAWHSVKDAAAAAWDAMLGIGRTKTPEERLADLRKEIAQEAVSNRNSPNRNGGAASDSASVSDRNSPTRNAPVSAKEQEAAALEKVIARQRVSAALQSEKLVKDQKETDFRKLELENIQKEEKLQTALDNARARAKADGISENDPRLQKVLADITANAHIKPAPVQRNSERSSLEADIQAIKDAEAKKLTAYKTSEDLFNAQRSAGLVSEKDYAEQKQVYLQLEESAEINSIDAQIKKRKEAVFTGTDATNKQNENQKQLGIAIAKRGEIEDKIRSKSQIGAVQDAYASAQRLIAYELATKAANSYIASLNKQNDVQHAIFTLTAQQASQVTSNASINARADSEKSRLDDQLAAAKKNKVFNDDVQADYEHNIAVNETLRNGELAANKSRFEQMLKDQQNWANGSAQAFNEYLENADNAAKQTHDAFSHALTGIEDALVTFATTGKLSFKSLVDSIIADIARAQVQKFIAGAVTTAASGGFGTLVQSVLGAFGVGAPYTGTQTSGGFGGTGQIDRQFPSGIGTGAANGGTLLPNSMTPVNERGPELLTVGGQTMLMAGSRGGKVTPNQGSGHTFNLGGNVINVGQGVSRAEVFAAVNQSAQEQMKQLNRLRKSGALT